MVRLSRRHFLHAAGAAAGALGLGEWPAAAAAVRARRWAGAVYNEQAFAAAAPLDCGYAPPPGLAGIRLARADDELALRFLVYHL